MPIVVDCPACGGKLRVADDLLGRLVRCPSCKGTFTATPPSPPDQDIPSGRASGSEPEAADPPAVEGGTAGQSPPPPAWPNLSLDEPLNEPTPSLGTVNLQLSLDEGSAPPPDLEAA